MNHLKKHVLAHIKEGILLTQVCLLTHEVEMCNPFNFN